MRKLLPLVCLCAVLLSLAPTAQEFKGAIAGRVTDPTGGVIPGATVTATNMGTNTTSNTLTDDAGNYTIPYLTPGKYRLTVEVPGFKKFVQEGITVLVQSTSTVNVTLEVGQVAEVVAVTAEAELLESSTASAGQVIDNRRINDLPLNGRNPFVLTHLSAGVVPVNDPRFTRTFDNFGTSDISVAGTPRRANDFTLDGVTNITTENRAAFIPPPDAVQEFKVETASFDASQGHTAGGIVNVSLKSGTNDPHGTVYYFHRDSAGGANSFFNNLRGQPLPVQQLHQYGFTTGGPVWLPKIYNGKDRTFWFFSYDGLRDSFPEPSFATVPTPRMRQGDFSELLPQGITIYNPFTTRPDPSQPGRFLRDPFPNNIIPSNLINPVARALMQFIPDPNAPGDAQGRNNFFNGKNSRTDKFASIAAKADHSIGNWYKGSGHFYWNHRTEFRGNVFNNISTGNLLQRINWGFAFDQTFTASPTLLFNARYGWGRFEEPSGNTQNIGFDLTRLGFPASFARSVAQAHLPRIRFSTFREFGGRGLGETDTDIHSLFFSGTKIYSKHALKAGLDIRVLKRNSINKTDSSGDFFFGTDWTRGPFNTSGSAPIGQDFATFLLGLPTGGSANINADQSTQSVYYALFIHDDWKMTPKLTINAGLRWEYESPPTERFNRAVRGFDPTAASPIEAAARAAYAANPIPQIPPDQFQVKGGLRFAGVDGTRFFWPRRDRNNFAPRLGAAYRIDNQTVIRGGYGIYYVPRNFVGAIQTGFSESTPFIASLDFGQTFLTTLSNPFPAGLTPPSGASLGLATFLGRGISFFNPRLVNAFMQRWELSLQREITRGLVIELAYIGNHGNDLPINRPGEAGRQFDPTPRQFLSTSPVRDQATIDFLSAAVANPFAGLLPGTGLNGATVSRAQLLRPFPQFTGITLFNDNFGSSIFHSMVVRVEKRFARGFTFLANYEWSKLLEETTLLNDTDTKLERRVSEIDRPHRFVVSSIYELPFGRGKRFGSDATGVLGHLVSGWQINGIYTAQSGAPLDWGNVIYFGGKISIPRDQQTIDRWFNTVPFERDPNKQLGSNIRTVSSRFNDVRADRINNLDFSLVKNTRVTERVGVQLRIEAFNAFNHVIFNPPSRDPTSTNFGKVTSQANLPRQLQFGLKVLF